MRLPTEAKPKRVRLTLLAIAVVCALPIVAAWTAYLLGWSPGTKSNYGALIKPHPVPDVALAGLDGRSFRLSQLRGKWVMLTFGASSCDEPCVRRLYYMRQIRVAQGENMGRVERVWVLTDSGVPSPKLLAAYRGTYVVRGAGANFERAFTSAHGVIGHIFLIDPLGNVMMRFPRNPDPTRILKDVQRLLRYSSVG